MSGLTPEEMKHLLAEGTKAARQRLEAERSRTPNLTLMKQAEAAPPDFDARYREVAQRVVNSLAVPEEKFFRFAWPGMHALVGALRPASVMVITAYTGIGKTTWGRNAVSYMVDAGERPYVVAAEEDAADYLQALAAMRCQLSVSKVMLNRWRALPEGSITRVVHEVDRLRESIVFAPSRVIDVPCIRRAYTEAQQAGCTCILIDHIHHGDRRYEATCARMYALRDYSIEFQLPGLALAQLLKKEGLVFAGHVPPLMGEVEGGMVISECADVVFGLYQPLRTDANRSKLAKREVELRECLVVGQVNGRVLKHRLDGSRMHREGIFHYDAGRLSDPPDFQLEAEL